VWPRLGTRGCVLVVLCGRPECDTGVGDLPLEEDPDVGHPV
jgi:hypothetical protein